MNYDKIYRQIIKYRQENPLHKDEYGENHHIIPRCLGGSDDKNNLVRLSAREHFICHMLLAEMYPKNSNEWYKMNHAFIFMKATSFERPRYMNNRYYELKKMDFSEVMSNSQSDKNNSQFGTVWVYSLNERKSIKVHKSLLSDYLENGYTLGRIENFNLYYDKLNLIKITTQQKKAKKILLTYNKYDFSSTRSIQCIKQAFNINIEVDGIQQLYDLLYELYINKRLTTTAIGIKFNLKYEAIRQYLIKLGIPLRKVGRMG